MIAARALRSYLTNQTEQHQRRLSDKECVLGASLDDFSTAGRRS